MLIEFDALRGTDWCDQIRPPAQRLIKTPSGFRTKSQLKRPAGRCDQIPDRPEANASEPVGQRQTETQRFNGERTKGFRLSAPGKTQRPMPAEARKSIGGAPRIGDADPCIDPGIDEPLAEVLDESLLSPCR